jgi:hypothetical protein
MLAIQIQHEISYKKWNVNTPTSHSGGLRFENKPAEQPLWLRFSVGFFAPQAYSVIIY